MNLCKQRKTSNQRTIWVQACRKVNGSVALHYTARTPARRRAHSTARPTAASPSARTCGVKIKRERPPRPSSRPSAAWTDAPPHTGNEALNTDNVHSRRPATAAAARAAVAAAAGGDSTPDPKAPRRSALEGTPSEEAASDSASLSAGGEGGEASSRGETGGERRAGGASGGERADAAAAAEGTYRW